MKLWIRQTLITLTVVLLSVSLCLYFFVARETNNLIRQAIQAGERDTAVFCDHLATLERSAVVNDGADELVRQSLIQYTFSSYARLLQNQSCSWSLVMDGRYYYRAASHDPWAALPVTEDIITASRVLVTEDKPLLVSCQQTTILQLPILVYRTMDLSETWQHMDNLTRMAQLSLLGCLILCAALLPIILRRTLKPLRTLTRISERIAGGEYDLRSNIPTQDEVGELSASFDHMAETVEQKIADLEETARRRELLLGALTHEMKTPMTAIIGFSGSLLSMPLTEEGRMEAAYEINEAAKRTERLSQKMMQLISMQENPVVTMKSIHAKELLEKVTAALASAAAEKGITLETACRADQLTGDPDLLFSLLTNLTDNAMKASQENSIVTLMYEKTQDRTQILSVVDHGAGIPADKITLVTEPFYRVDKARSRKLGGAGLGLSLCQMIAKAHEGRLEIRSQMGNGTTVSMLWPEGGRKHE